MYIYIYIYISSIDVYIYYIQASTSLSVKMINCYKYIYIHIYRLNHSIHIKYLTLMYLYIYIYGTAKVLCTCIYVCVQYLSKPIRRPAGVSCGSCLFVVVLSVLSLSLSRLSPWHGFLPRLTWAPPTPPPLLPPPPLSSSYSLRCGGLNSAHALRSTPAWFCTSCCHFDGCFRFLVLFAIGLLRRFLYPILDPLAFVPNTFYTYNLSTYGLFQSLSQYGLFQNPGLHTCFGLNLNRGLNKINVFASKPSFTQRAVLHRNCILMLSTNTMFHTKTVFLLGLCKGCLQLTEELFPWWPAEQLEGG